MKTKTKNQINTYLSSTSLKSNVLVSFFTEPFSVMMMCCMCCCMC